MDKPLKNLFPPSVRRGAIEIFGKQVMHFVLLQLLPAFDASGHCLKDSYFGRMLHPKEAAILSGYKLPKRRSEYLTGRICAKKAVRGFFNLTGTHGISPTLSDIEITNEANGRPTVCFHIPVAPEDDAVKMDISIAHSGGYAVALAAVPRCGIDLQRQGPAVLRVQEKYCSKIEYRLLASLMPYHDATARLTMLWAAKEAAKKALSHWQMPGFLELELVKPEKSSANCIVLALRVSPAKSPQMPCLATVVTDIFDGYAIAICLVGEDESYA